MAKARSTVYDAATHGGLGNLIAQRDRHGRPYVRSRRTGRRRPSPRQAQIRNNWKLLQLRWRDTLTQTQRDGWATYAHHPNTFADAYTGQQIYIRNNLLRSLATTDEAGYDLDPVVIDEHPHFPYLPKLGELYFAIYAGDNHGYIDSFFAAPLTGHNTYSAILLWIAPLNYTGTRHLTSATPYPFPLPANRYAYCDTIVSHPEPDNWSLPLSFRLPFTPAAGDRVSLIMYYTDSQARTSKHTYRSLLTVATGD